MSLFLHQTTTDTIPFSKYRLLYMSLFLHQTTTTIASSVIYISCICLYSYIKPQRLGFELLSFCVVYVSIPTSNHNRPAVRLPDDDVVYVSIPTSNHNRVRDSRFRGPVVYVSIPTSNHNLLTWTLFVNLLYMSLFLHQTTTAAKNLRKIFMLYMSLFLHQTTTR